MKRSRLQRDVSCAVLLLCMGAAALAAPWAVRTPPPEPVPFRGVASMDGVGAPGAMMYPAPGLAGLVAAIATHAVIANSIHQGAKSDIEKAADKILDPYGASLAAFTQRELLQSAAALSRHGAPRWLAAADKADSWIVTSQPVLSMTQDRAALVLDNEVSIVAPSGQPVYGNRIRIVSAVHTQEDLAAYWGADDARALKAESARLLAASLDIALDEAGAPRAAGSTGTQRTVRYPEGGKQVFERAEVLKEDCDRLLVRNLRGWLMSVPRTRPADAGCQVSTL